MDSAIYQPRMERDGMGFYRYLPVSRRDWDWGLCVFGGGNRVVGPGVDPDAHPPGYEYDWERGRTFVDKYAALLLLGGSDFEFESDSFEAPVLLKPGTVILLFPGVWHRYRTSAAKLTSYHWFVFGGALVERWGRRGLISTKRAILPSGGSATTIEAFRRLVAGLGRSDYGLQQYLAACAFDAVGAAVAADEAGQCTEVQSLDAIDNARRILETNVDQEVDFERLATACGMSYRRFREDFSKVTGMPPHQYRMGARIERAKELLVNTDLSIKEIAALLRFSDQFHFARTFKQKTLRTPTQWRTSANPNLAG